MGIEVGPILDRAPRDSSEIERIKTLVNSKLIKGRLVSNDGSATMILANLEKGTNHTKLTENIKTLLKKYEGEERFYLSGEQIVNHEIEVGIGADMAKLLPLALLLMLISLYFAFKTARGVVLPISLVILSNIWMLGFMGLLGIPMSVVSSALPLLLIAVGSSYGIHVVHRCYEEISKTNVEDGIRRALKSVVSPVLITGLTSALGAITLIVFEVQSIKEFGIVAAIGIISALVLSLTYVPAFFSILRMPKGGKSERRDDLIASSIVGLTRFSINNKVFVLAITVSLVGLSLYGITLIRVGVDNAKLFPPDHEIQRSFKFMNDKLGGSQYMSIMFEGKTTDSIKTPEMLNAMDRLQQHIEQSEFVGYTSSIVDVVKRIHYVTNYERDSFYVIPESPDLIAQYILLYSLSADSSEYDDLIDFSSKKTKINVMLKTQDLDVQASLFEDWRKYTESEFSQDIKVDYGGSIMIWMALVKYIVVGKIENMISVFIVVLLFCSIVYRSLVGGIYSIAPLTISTIITFGIMGFIGIRLNVATAMITAIAVGVGVDFAIHYLSRFREEYSTLNSLEAAAVATAGSTGKAITFDVMSNILGFIVFVFSGFMPLQEFGYLITVNMLTVFLATLVILPILLTTFNPRFISTKVEGKLT